MEKAGRFTRVLKSSDSSPEGAPRGAQRRGFYFSAAPSLIPGHGFAGLVAGKATPQARGLGLGCCALSDSTSASSPLASSVLDAPFLV